MATNTTTVTGKVTRTNGKGFVLDNGDWRNISRFAKADEAPMPRTGEFVTVTLDNAGFVRKVEPAAISGGAPTASEATEPATATTGEAPDRERIITRQWAVNAAINFIGGDGVSLDDVLSVAARLEAWALRPI